MPLKQLIIGPSVATSFLLSALLYKIAKEEIKEHFKIKLKEIYIQIITIALGIIAAASVHFNFYIILSIIYALGLLLPPLFVYKNKITIKASLYFLAFLIAYEAAYLIISSI